MQGNCDRRRFIGLVAGCAVPLLVPTALLKSAGGQAAAASGEGDVVLDHVKAELVRTFRAAKADGVTGEHIRVVGANFGLLLAALHERGHDVRADKAIRRTVRDHGREAAVADAIANYPSVVADAKREGIELRADLDVEALRKAVDLIHSKGFDGALKGHRGQFEKLAARIDRDHALMTTGVVRRVQACAGDFDGSSLAVPVWGCYEYNIFAAACALMAVVIPGAGVSLGALAGTIYLGLAIAGC